MHLSLCRIQFIIHEVANTFDRSRPSTIQMIGSCLFLIVLQLEKKTPFANLATIHTLNFKLGYYGNESKLPTSKE